MSTRWGLLPIGLPLAWLVVVRVGSLVFPGAALHKRVLTGGVLTLALIAVGVQALGTFGLLTTGWLLGVLAAVAVGFSALSKAREGRFFPAASGNSFRAFASRETALPLLAVAAGLAIVTASACYLPVWQWDAIGYHLPFVNFALQRGTLADVPPDVPYLATYPHVIEYAYVAWRALLPDDRLVDLAQLPFGLMGAVAIAGIARRYGARTDHAIVGGLLWLTLPGVFLQLPTNYIDVASAALLLTAGYFLLGELGPREIVVVGITLGLFLGSKPNAPVGTVLLFGVLILRLWKDTDLDRRRKIGWIGAAAGIAFVLGAESYVGNTIHHGNPVWPVKLSLGPIHLPGTLPMSALLESGAGAPRVHGNVLVRIVKSWPAIFSPPAFDMRIGGLGVLFLAALPFAIRTAIRRRGLALAGIAIAALASPDPAVARYILAFPGLVLALAVPALSELGSRARMAALTFAAAGAALNLVVATPGLAGEGPPISAYPALSEAERARAVGADGPPTGFLDALDRLGPGELTVFDASFDLPYLAWPSDLAHHARRIPDGTNAPEAARILQDPRVRLLVLGDDLVTGRLAKLAPETFVPLFHCKSASCTVYLRN